MPTIRPSGAIVLTTLFALAAAPATALEYPCPTDPGFCYFDVADDGCFDGGVDDGPIDAALEAGAYAPGVPGSIVCPPSVKKLTGQSTINWQTEAGGDIRIYGARIGMSGDQHLLFTAGGRVDVEGQIATAGFILIRGDEGVSLDGRFASSDDNVTVRSENGDIDVAERSSFKTRGSNRLITNNGGAITVGSRVKMRSKFGSSGIEADGAAHTTDLVIVGDGGEVRGSTVEMTGRTIVGIPSSDDGGFFQIGGGTVDIEVIRAKAGFISVNATGNLSIGGPGQPSRLRSGEEDVLVFSGGDVRFENVRISTPKSESFAVTTTSGLIELLDSFVRAGAFELSPTSPSTCDVTGTSWKKVDPVFDCDVVVGP
jgi:hypothetical protein